MSKKINIGKMLPHGEAKGIATRLGLTAGSVSAALRRANPGHPAVREALRIIEDSGSLKAAQTLTTIAQAA